MKAVIQRVLSASVRVDQKIISEINNGLLVLIGISKFDTKNDANYILNKILKLRIFSSENGCFDRNIKDIGGEVLFVSQFTLYADCQKGNRPSFINAMPSELAKRFYCDFLDSFKKSYPKIKDGLFGADMEVELINQGPVTIILDSKN